MSDIQKNITPPGPQQPENTPDPEIISRDSDPSPMQRMSSILSQDDSDPSQSWHDLLDGLPEDAAHLLQSRQQEDSKPMDSDSSQAAIPESEVPEANTESEDAESTPSTSSPASARGNVPLSIEDDPDTTRSEMLAQSMRDRGYLIEEDSSGIRLSGAPVRRGTKSSVMSASELVQLAADMDGGILPPEERLHCPHCDAVIKPTDTRCPWCSKDLSEASPPVEQTNPSPSD